VNSIYTSAGYLAHFIRTLSASRPLVPINLIINLGKFSLKTRASWKICNFSRNFNTNWEGLSLRIFLRTNMFPPHENCMEKLCARTNVKRVIHENSLTIFFALSLPHSLSLSIAPHKFRIFGIISWLRFIEKETKRERETVVVCRLSKHDGILN
jgi:hypothetical protein